MVSAWKLSELEFQIKLYEQQAKAFQQLQERATYLSSSFPRPAFRLYPMPSREDFLIMYNAYFYDLKCEALFFRFGRTSALDRSINGHYDDICRAFELVDEQHMKQKN